MSQTRPNPALNSVKTIGCQPNAIINPLHNIICVLLSVG